MFGHFHLKPNSFSFPVSTQSYIPNSLRMFPFTFPLTSPKFLGLSSSIVLSFLFLLEGFGADNQMFKSPMDDWKAWGFPANTMFTPKSIRFPGFPLSSNDS